MKTAEEILINKGEAWEYSNRLQVTPVADAYNAMKQVAELAFNAGMERRADEIDGSYNQHQVTTPTKDQFIQKLFNENTAK